MRAVADQITTEQLNELVDVDPLRLRDVAVELLAERDRFRTERNATHAVLAEALGTEPATLGKAAAQAITAIEQVKRVRELHPKKEHPTYGCCGAPKICTKPHPAICNGASHGINRPAWPCDEIRALDGTEESHA